MACPAVTSGTPSVRAMLNAFQDGSGLCAGSISFGVTAAIILGAFLISLWYIIAQYKEWTNDKEDFSYWGRIFLALAFIPMSGILFLR